MKILVALAMTAATAAAAPAPAVHSPARTDWPCKLVVQAADAATWDFEYAGPEACVVPVELHEVGIVGCPTAIAITNPAAHYESHRTLTYDKAGHLISYRESETLEHDYEWHGDRLVSETRANHDYRLSYEAGAHVVKLSEGKPLVEITTDDRNRAIALDQLTAGSVYSRTQLGWNGARLATIETTSLADHEVTKAKLVYDCKR